MEDLAKFLTAQIHAIDKSVYLESEKTNFNLRYDYDGRPSQQFFLLWVDKHASAFKNAWDTSLCKKCKKVNNCYDCLRESCPDFEI